MFENKIWVEKGFQTSINISYDLNDEDKIKRFIPTTSSIELIEDVMLSTISPEKSRARIFIGAYGKGKSHITLMILSLLSKKNKELFKGFLEHIKIYDKNLHNFLCEYINSDKKLLPIVISGSSTSITQAFLVALQSALVREDLLDIMPETHFMAAINTINLWKSDYTETYIKFLNELNVNIDEFMIKLKEYNVNAYDQFKNIFPKMTSGSSFNPFLGFDVVDIYDSVVVKLKDKGYSGVYIVYDEFSKYLESSIANTTISDIKLLQDFAEKCDRSGNNEMHLMLISHKDIANYINNSLPKEKVDGWKGVSGRFEHMNFHNNFYQMYEIISSVIKKDNKFWKKYHESNNMIFDDMLQVFQHNGLFDTEYEDVNSILNGCYPLHLVSAFILPRLSEKVAQNERTLFTFLSADSKDTLSEFLENTNEKFPLVTPDIIFDYFDPLLRKEPYTSEIFKIYETAKKVINKLNENTLKVKIIKTIALIYIVEQFERLAPTKDLIVDIYKYSTNEIADIDSIITELIEQNYLIYLKRSNGYLKIKETSGEDVVSEIRNLAEKTKLSLNLTDILNTINHDRYLYPTAYNDENEIVRYFDFKFISCDDFLKVKYWEDEIKNTRASGVVFAIISKSKSEVDRIKDVLISEKCKHERILFVLLNEYTQIETIAYEYYAAKNLRDSINEDAVLYDEYSMYVDDLEEVLSGYIQNFTKPENQKSTYFYNRNVLNLRRKAQISTKLSEICYNTFLNTPIIKNESINKNILPTVAINSRNKLINSILNGIVEKDLGLQGMGQEVSFMRSTLVNTGILINTEIDTSFTLTPENQLMSNFLNEIYAFMLNTTNSNGKNFNVLYNILTEPEYGYGIKRGVIPIYLAVVLRELKEKVVVKHNDEEVKISVDVLNSINENPEEYSIYLENWNDEKGLYIKSLENLFKDNIVMKEKDYGSFLYITNGISRWYMNLPRYSKDLKKVYMGQCNEPVKLKRSDLKFISFIKQSNANPRELLFEKFIKAYEFECFNIDVFKNIKEIKNRLENAKIGLIEKLIIDVSDIFIKFESKEASLASIITSFTESLKPTTLNYLFPDGEHRVLEILCNINNNENEFIEKLAKAVTGLRIDDWSDDTVIIFIQNLITIKKSILDIDTNEKLDNHENMSIESNSYAVVFHDESGKEVKRTFEKISYSPRGKLLFNQIKSAIDDMGQSITEQEKRQILMEFIEKFC